MSLLHAEKSLKAQERWRRSSSAAAEEGLTELAFREASWQRRRSTTVSERFSDRQGDFSVQEQQLLLSSWKKLECMVHRDLPIQWCVLGEMEDTKKKCRKCNLN